MSTATQATSATSPPLLTLSDDQCARVAALLSLTLPTGAAS